MLQDSGTQGTRKRKKSWPVAGMGFVTVLSVPSPRIDWTDCQFVEVSESVVSTQNILPVARRAFKAEAELPAEIQRRENS